MRLRPFRHFALEQVKNVLTGWLEFGEGLGGAADPTPSLRRVEGLVGDGFGRVDARWESFAFVVGAHRSESCGGSECWWNVGVEVE